MEYTDDGVQEIVAEVDEESARDSGEHVGLVGRKRIRATAKKDEDDAGTN